MSDSTITPEFDELADVFWRRGVMQSPSALQGRLAGQLAVGGLPSDEQWLVQARDFLDPVGAFTEQDRQVLLELHSVTCSQITGGELNFELLLPDEMVDIRQRLESLGQWCQGFLVGFAKEGKELQQQKGQQQYSDELSETLSDMAAICQVDVGDDKVDLERSERDFFEISEYLRLAAVNIYFECHQDYGVATAPVEHDDQAVNSPIGLFNKKRTLH